jgi:hypothetical protein
MNHTPLGAVAPYLEFPGDSLGHTVSVVGGIAEGAGSSFSLIETEFEDETMTYTYHAKDTVLRRSVAAGLPWSCVGRCRVPSGMYVAVAEQGGAALATGLDRLSRLFAVIYNTYEWDEVPAGYSRDDGASDLDYRELFIGAFEPPSVVPVSLATCTGAGDVCLEFPVDGISVNGQTRDQCFAGGSAVNVQIQYYAYADSNHMPIRRKIVDFGDGSQPILQEGSFKNHHGLDSYGEEICGGTNEEGEVVDFGLTNDACDSRYYREQKTYTCSQAFASTLDYCTPLNPFYPCQNESECCVFKPRVQILDNWGLCNGVCTGGPGEDMCFNSGPLDGYIEATHDADDEFNECYTLGSGGIDKEQRRYSGPRQPWTEGPEITVCPGLCTTD